MEDISVGKLLFTVDAANQLGEGVQWHENSQSIWWTDIQRSLLFSYCVSSNKLNHFTMPDRVGSFAFTDNDERLIIAFAKGIAWYDLSSQNLQWLHQPEIELAANRFNDGRVDRQGRFWAGTMVESEHQQTAGGALYMVDSVGIHKKVPGLHISNSLCWSPDGMTMYHSDSPGRVIYQYDFEPQTAKLGNKKTFATTAPGAVPDGAAVDAQGGVWCAHWGAAKVVRYFPNGKVSTVVDLPVQNPTCVAIGGPNFDWLIISSARQGLGKDKLQAEPQNGDLLVYSIHGVTGLPEEKFRHKPQA
ncbi:SMP-30/gluconolactonase/LRE family protein [Thalassotalea mangrovi]|uniref:SMP-30/gluconolactonase/LRE family protein n=1 Tax=Thalassotalea mangrovi TaxID=2572245 RepID=A0A4U1B2L1_9GAMM|nr:SMP-30/gluconolactonase/LRE family protein [Thalassotalea mangrovi]TKB43833.1 SMP-30/gluconolactonase/LRE family protein [Thalassotalea mangrovi]